MSAVKNLIIASLLAIGIGAPSGVAVANAVKNKSLTQTVSEITEENKNLKNNIENKDIIITIKDNQISNLEQVKTGLFDSDSGNLLKSWTQLINDGDVHLSSDYLSLGPDSRFNKELNGSLYCGYAGDLTDFDVLFAFNSLNEIDLSNINSLNITSMAGMFKYSYDLRKINFQNFDTSKVTDMGGMFKCCLNLPEIDVSNFNTSNVVNMSYMFEGCNNLQYLDISNFDMSNVTGTSNMFDGCSSLRSINLGRFDISFEKEFVNSDNVKYYSNIEYMFLNCNNLTDLIYDGTIEEWKSKNIINESTSIKEDGTVTVHCNDGDYVITSINSGDVLNKIDGFSKKRLNINGNTSLVDRSGTKNDFIFLGELNFDDLSELEDKKISFELLDLSGTVLWTSTVDINYQDLSSTLGNESCIIGDRLYYHCFPNGNGYDSTPRVHLLVNGISTDILKSVRIIKMKLVLVD